LLTELGIKIEFIFRTEITLIHGLDWIDILLRFFMQISGKNNYFLLLFICHAAHCFQSTL